MTAFYCQVRPYVVRVKPLAGLVDLSSDSTYNGYSRPGSLVGNYGYYNDNGEFVVVEDSQLVNESDSSFYNPATGTTGAVKSWTYDYSDRSYQLTLEGGDTITVKYGDQNVTINQGDTVYNIYYTVPGAEDPADCDHTYVSTTTKAPTCISSGIDTYTCTKCGDSYTKTIPATGHQWEIKQQVHTAYDESGNVITQGYTLYACSVCGEQYKDVDSTGPPNSGGSSGSTSIGGLIEQLLSGVGSVFSGIIKGVLTLLTKAAEALSGIGDIFVTLVESVTGLFGGFTSFLAAVFPFLPEEFMTILTLGFVLLVAAAVIRKLLDLG